MTDRTEVQGMLRELREQQDAQRNQNEARAAVSGETKEQQIAEQQGLNKAFADSVANIASNSSMLKDGLLDGYDNSMRQYYEAKRAHNTAMGQIAQNTSNQWAQAANNGVGLMAGSAQTLAGAVGDWPKSTPPAGQEQPTAWFERLQLNNSQGKPYGSQFNNPMYSKLPSLNWSYNKPGK